LATILELEGVNFINSSGNTTEQQYWLTMMNYATNEREPERQFCLISKDLAKNIREYRKQSDQERNLMAELTTTELRMNEIKIELDRINHNREENVNYEGNNVEIFPDEKTTGKAELEKAVEVLSELERVVEELSEEIDLEGEKYKIVYKCKGENKFYLNFP
jgi:septal ring factor EnvC (AmiA/AmiB activator)